MILGTSALIFSILDGTSNLIIFLPRIKQISLAYARSYVVDKMLNWKGQGIIFNVDTSDVRICN